MKQQIIYSKIIRPKLIEFKPNNEKIKLLGLLIGDIFYDLSKEIEKRTSQSTIQKILKKSDIILNPLTEKPMQIICSYKDMEDIKNGA